MARHCLIAALAAALVLSTTERTTAAVDLTGEWNVILTSEGTFSLDWTIVQTGTTLTITGDSSFSGTIDPDTGDFSISGSVSGQPCPPDTFTGTAAADSNSFTGSGFVQAPFSGGCTPFFATIDGARDLCGDGAVNLAEECDDGNVAAGDCCSPTCQIDPDGTSCDDGNPSTLYNVCVSGTCITPAGVEEFQVNTTTSYSQQEADIACDDTGAFMVVWEHHGGFQATRIFGQRYDSAGTPLGSEIEIAQLIDPAPAPDVAVDADGDAVVVWKWVHVMARRYSSSGSPAGLEFVVNTDTSEVEAAPSVAADNAGNFVVVWSSHASSGPPESIWARRFASDGSPLGTPFQVSALGADPSAPDVASDASGNFVVVWENSGIRGRRYDSAGTPLGTEFPIGSGCCRPAVATGEAGQFVVTWTGAGTRAQRFSSTGTPVGTEMSIAPGGFRSDVTIDAGGNFVITWSGPEPDDHDVFGRRFNSSGIALGPTFQANGFTYNLQLYPAACAAPDGDFIVVWQSFGQDGERYGVFGRQFDVQSLFPPVDHYKCYQGADLKNPQFVKQFANTSDQITSEAVEVQKLKFVCTPVDKDGEGIVDPAAHLACYQIKGAKLAPRPAVEVSTQFQPSRFELKKPKLLCAPATKTLLP